jgi:adenine phosphoribosyltransferase
MNLKDYIRSVPDFPKPGIMFRDITPLLKSADAMKEVIRRLAEPFRDAGVTSILAAEARGFVFGAPLAMELGAAFVPVRKPGKLPWETHKFSYDLEYGSDSLEIHCDAIGDWWNHRSLYETGSAPECRCCGSGVCDRTGVFEWTSTFEFNSSEQPAFIQH